MPKAYVRKILIVSIQLLLVAVTLALSVASFAWYLSNQRVEVTVTTVTAQKWGNVEITPEPPGISISPYMGQTGVWSGESGDKDEPYGTIRMFRLKYAYEGAPMRLYIKLSAATVTKGGSGGTTIDNGHMPEGYSLENVEESFTWRAEIIDGAETPATLYRLAPSDEQGFAKVTWISESESEAGQTVGEHYHITESMDALIRLEIVFLKEDWYLRAISDSHDNRNPFFFSDTSYMGSLFTLVFDMGCD